MKYSALSLLALLLHHIALADPRVVTTCREELRKTLVAEKKYITDIFASGKGWRIKYQISSEVLNKQTRQYQRSDVEGVMIAGEHMRYKKTKNAEVFVDEHDIFTISNASQTIMHTYTNSKELKVKDDVYSEVLQDSLFKLMSITNCDKVKMGNKEVVCYNLKSDVARCPYSKLQVYADPSTKFILKIHVLFNLDYQKDIKEYTFLIMDKREVNIEPSWLHLKEKFLNSSGKLKDGYAKYTLEDPGKYEQKPVRANGEKNNKGSNSGKK